MTAEAHNGKDVLELRKWAAILWDWLQQGAVGVAALGLMSLLYRLATGAPPQKYSQVDAHLQVGGQHLRRGWEKLRAGGVTGVVNMRSEFDDASAGIAPERYLHLPTIDNTPPTLEHLRAGVSFIREEIDRGGGVYVHCDAGVGRAPTMAAVYLVSTGLTPKQAWERIRRIRPFIRPTKGQRAQVERFAAELRLKQAAAQEERSSA